MDIRAKVSELDFSRDVKSCSPRTTLKKVLNILQESRIGSICIVENDKITGIFTERDYLLKVAGEEKEHLNRPISSLMTKNPRCVTSEQRITEVLELMHNGGFRHVIVVNKNQTLEGIISVKDLTNHLLKTIQGLEENLRELVACVA